VGNAVCAVRLLEALSAHHAFELPARSIRAAVEDAVWPGRLEPALVEGIEVLLDGAHNPAGARALARYILETAGRPVPMVVGAMRDKAIGALIAALAPGASRFLFTAASTPRAAAAADLTAAAASVAPSVPRSTHARPLAAIREAAPHGLPVVVAGSLHLVGEVRREVVRAS
jgi:dihydrofolate synthase/folylpolyglutamate synthase